MKGRYSIHLDSDVLLRRYRRRQWIVQLDLTPVANSYYLRAMVKYGRKLVSIVIVENSDQRDERGQLRIAIARARENAAREAASAAGLNGV